jgi:hypothetical protein
MLAGVLKDIDSQIAELEVTIKEKERCVAVATAQSSYAVSKPIYSLSNLAI